ncbi:MAG: hypothetical protein KIG57_04285 [Muribaculaceae bacterium]|nr:hypothetical protein [Muribaculaceae bacterium]
MQTYENFLKKQSGGLGMLEGVAHLERLAHLKHLFCSDLDQKRAVFWSKSEMKHLKHPETPETLGTLETLCVDVGIAVL